MERTPSHRSYFFYALLLHLIVLFFLIASLDFSEKMPVVQRSDVINARAMNLPALPKKIVSQSAPPKPVVSQTTPLPVIPVIKPREVVEKKEDIVIPDKKKSQKKLQPVFVAKQLLDDLKKQTEPQKKIKHQAVAAAFEKEIKDLRAKSLQQQMLQEQKRMAGVRSQEVQSEIDKYKALILQAISAQWLLPPTIDKKLYAELLIRVAPGGSVLDVQLIKSSGDVLLDRSARAAVFKASPLPVPADADVFDSFRQFVLKVKPENVLGK